jgi:hypothetical protein
VRQLLSLIAESNIPAPCPIEQRWTCGGAAPMSPATPPPGRLSAEGHEEEEIYSWVVSRELRCMHGSSLAIVWWRLI